MSEQLRALVTTGGTTEPIDDVRAITNFATGELGMNIAKQLQRHGVETFVMCPQDVKQRYDWRDPEESYEFPVFDYFSSAAELDEAMHKYNNMDLIFHAAAVSDYTPVDTFSGKLSSDQEEMLIKLKRTPKIIDSLRDHYGQDTYIVGFKLLSGVNEKEMATAALAQMARAHTNMCVVTDKRQIKPAQGGLILGDHPLKTFTPDSFSQRFNGPKSLVAQYLVRYVLHEKGYSPSR